MSEEEVLVQAKARGTPLSPEALASEAEVTVDLVTELTRIGVLSPTSPEEFVPGDVLRIRTAQAFLHAGISLDQIELAIRERIITFEYIDQYYLDPPPRSKRTYAEVRSSLGEKAGLLESIYTAFELPEPAASARLSTEEETVLNEFIEAWGAAGDEETFIRAARLIGGAARQLNEGWLGLFVEKFSLPPGEQESRDETIGRTLEPGTRLAMLGPRMFVWLQQRHLEHAQVAMAVEYVEEGLARLGLVPARQRTLPAIAFVDLSGYTRMTEERGDASAVRFASILHDEAETVARRHGGRLVKLLGDGAMLFFPDPSRAVPATMELVRSLAEVGLPAHAGVHAGPVIERDRDFFGRTVNVAARIAGKGGPTEVLVTDSVLSTQTDPRISFKPLGKATLKGVPEPVPLFRAEPRENT